MKFRTGFTMLELVFVIVIMGIIGKFGVEFLADAYKSFLYSNINNRLQSQSATAVEFISTRLQHRIKDSIIAKKSDGTFKSLASSDFGSSATILEWIGSDAEGFRGLSNDILPNLPNWSGVMDLDAGDKTKLVSPESNTTKIDSLIDILSGGNSSINDAAIYFIGSDSDIVNGYGWNGAITDQNQVMHPIKAGTNLDEFISGISGIDFSGVDIYEYYKLAWSAYAIVLNNNTLTMYYDYQPWFGESYTDGKSSVLMENVSTFRFTAIGSLVKIQVCVKSNFTNEEYSICKEKTVF